MRSSPPGSRMATGLALILGFQAAGTALQAVLGWGVPGPVVGFFLLWAALQLGVIPAEAVEPAAELLLGHLLLLFTPVVASLLPHAPLLAANAPALLAAVAAGTVATLLVTGWTAQLLMSRAARCKEGKRRGQ